MLLVSFQMYCTQVWLGIPHLALEKTNKSGQLTISHPPESGSVSCFSSGTEIMKRFQVKSMNHFVIFRVVLPYNTFVIVLENHSGVCQCKTTNTIQYLLNWKTRWCTKMLLDRKAIFAELKGLSLWMEKIKIIYKKHQLQL